MKRIKNLLQKLFLCAFFVSFNSPYAFAERSMDRVIKRLERKIADKKRYNINDEEEREDISNEIEDLEEELRDKKKKREKKEKERISAKKEEIKKNLDRTKKKVAKLDEDIILLNQEREEEADDKEIEELEGKIHVLKKERKGATKEAEKLQQALYKIGSEEASDKGGKYKGKAKKKYDDYRRKSKKKKKAKERQRRLKKDIIKKKKRISSLKRKKKRVDDEELSARYGREIERLEMAIKQDREELKDIEKVLGGSYAFGVFFLIKDIALLIIYSYLSILFYSLSIWLTLLSWATPILIALSPIIPWILGVYALGAGSFGVLKWFGKTSWIPDPLAFFLDLPKILSYLQSPLAFIFSLQGFVFGLPPLFYKIIVPFRWQGVAMLIHETDCQLTWAKRDMASAIAKAIEENKLPSDLAASIEQELDRGVHDVSSMDKILDRVTEKRSKYRIIKNNQDNVVILQEETSEILLLLSSEKKLCRGGQMRIMDREAYIESAKNDQGALVLECYKYEAIKKAMKMAGILGLADGEEILAREPLLIDDELRLQIEDALYLKDQLLELLDEKEKSKQRSFTYMLMYPFLVARDICFFLSYFIKDPAVATKDMRDGFSDAIEWVLDGMGRVQDWCDKNIPFYKKVSDWLAKKLPDWMNIIPRMKKGLKKASRKIETKKRKRKRKARKRILETQNINAPLPVPPPLNQFNPTYSLVPVPHVPVIAPSLNEEASDDVLENRPGTRAVQGSDDLIIQDVSDVRVNYDAHGHTIITPILGFNKTKLDNAGAGKKKKYTKPDELKDTKSKVDRIKKRMGNRRKKSEEARKKRKKKPVQLRKDNNKAIAEAAIKKQKEVKKRASQYDKDKKKQLKEQQTYAEERRRAKLAQAKAKKEAKRKANKTKHKEKEDAARKRRADDETRQNKEQEAKNANKKKRDREREKKSRNKEASQKLSREAEKLAKKERKEREAQVMQNLAGQQKYAEERRKGKLASLEANRKDELKERKRKRKEREEGVARRKQQEKERKTRKKRKKKPVQLRKDKKKATAEAALKRRDDAIERYEIQEMEDKKAEREKISSIKDKAKRKRKDSHSRKRQLNKVTMRMRLVQNKKLEAVREHIYVGHPDKEWRRNRLLSMMRFLSSRKVSWSKPIAHPIVRKKRISWFDILNVPIQVYRSINGGFDLAEEERQAIEKYKVSDLGVLDLRDAFKNYINARTDQSAKLSDREAEDAKMINLRTMKGHTGIIYNTIFDPTGKYIASSSYDATIKVWDAESGEMLHSLEGHKYPVIRANFDRTGKRIVGIDGDMIKVWDVESGNLKFKKKFNAINATFGPSGKRIISASDDHKIKVWYIETKNIVDEDEGFDFGVYPIPSFDPSGKRIVSQKNNKIKVWDIESGATLREIEEDGVLHSLFFDQEGKRIISASDDHKIKVWDIESGALLHTLEENSSVYAASFDPSGKCVIAQGSDKIKVWDIENESLLHAFRKNFSGVSTVSMDFSGKRIVSSSNWLIHTWGLYRPLEITKKSMEEKKAMWLALAENRHIRIGKMNRTLYKGDGEPIFSGEEFRELIDPNGVMIDLFIDNGLYIHEKLDGASYSTRCMSSLQMYQVLTYEMEMSLSEEDLEAFPPQIEQVIVGSYCTSISTNLSPGSFRCFS